MFSNLDFDQTILKTSLNKEVLMLIAMQHWKVMLADLSILIFFSTETQAIPLPTKCTASHKLKSHFDEAFFCFAVGKTE